eukprot:CAMPEP_0168316760 /NCGR_PEP_ID=MMETSP0210-20121227/18937_1 /TAXON_ID=40633 /ORGANISM="Condylostoma magnum, Strain COL2" /LENGTH=34 /DNA_ID= /DNA_START= /DNA_END= /DNA_ORIENTATION=
MTPGRENWKFGNSMEVSEIKEDDIESVKDKLFYL